MLAEFNKQQPTIKFTIEKETHKSINFLDLTIQRQEQKLEYAIYRKPTQTNIIIPNDSCRPTRTQKKSSINYLMNRLNTYPISEEAKKKELNTIKNTLENNKYDRNKSKTQPNAKKQNTNSEPQHKKTKWATFTYSGKETKHITKLFKDTHIKISYKTRNTIQKLTKQHTQSDKYDSGIYQLKCLDCPLNTLAKQAEHCTSDA
jgi:hypothetical protein